MSDEPKVLMIGNVKFYRADVKEYKVQNGGSSNVNTVELKDGTKIRFWDQKPDSNASVFLGYDMARNNAPLGVKFTNIEGGNIFGTPNKDYYYLDNCSSFVGVGKDNNADEVVTVSRTGGKWPTIAKDDNDTVTSINLSEAEYINENEGFWYPDAAK